MLLPDEKARPQSESLAIPVVVSVPVITLQTDLAPPPPPLPSQAPSSPRSATHVSLSRAASSLRMGSRTPFKHRRRMVAILTTLLFIVPSLVISGVVVSVLADDNTLAPYSVGPLLTIPHHVVCIIKMYLHHRKRKALPLPRWMTSKLHLASLVFLAFSWLPIAIYMTIVNTRQLTKTDGDDVIERNTVSFIPAVLAYVELVVLLAMAAVLSRFRRALRPETRIDKPPRRTFPTSIAYLSILFPSILVSVSALVLLAVSISALVVIPAVSLIHHFGIIFAHLRHYRYSPPARRLRTRAQRLPTNAIAPPVDVEGLPPTYPPFFTSQLNIVLLVALMAGWIAQVILDLFFYVNVRSAQWHYVSGRYVPPPPNRPNWSGQGPPEMFIAAVSLGTVAAILTCLLFRLFFLARFDPVLSATIGGRKKEGEYLSDDDDDEEGEDEEMGQALHSPARSFPSAATVRSSVSTGNVSVTVEYTGLAPGSASGWSNRAMRSTSSLTPPGLMGLDLPPPAYTPAVGPGRSEGVSVATGEDAPRASRRTSSTLNPNSPRMRTRLRRGESARESRRMSRDVERGVQRIEEEERRIHESSSDRTLRARAVAPPSPTIDVPSSQPRSQSRQSIARSVAAWAGSSIAQRDDAGAHG